MRMRALVVYESMYGNTHTVATHIGEGLESTLEVTVVPAGEATTEMVQAADLLVVGGPTHAHGMTVEKSREAAVEAAGQAYDLTVDPDAMGEGLRDWFHHIGEGHQGHAVAFDTRFDGPVVLTGRASRGIAHRLRHHGFNLFADPESFLVDKANHLVEGEADRATAWGAELAEAVFHP